MILFAKFKRKFHLLRFKMWLLIEIFANISFGLTFSLALKYNILQLFLTDLSCLPNTVWRSARLTAQTKIVQTPKIAFVISE